MNVLSLFDGMSCGMIALERSGIKVDNYYASEIDKYAIKVSEANYPNIVRLGDVTKVKVDKGRHIDLLIAGSPCQGFSFAGKQLNFEDPRSKLFFEFVRLLKECRMYNPDVKFLLENVKMKKEYQDVISGYLGVHPVEINSALVSAQNRKRLYWTNIGGITQPEDKIIEAKSILESNVNKKYYISTEQMKRLQKGSLVRFGGICFKSPGTEKVKCDCLLARHYKGISGKQDFPIVMESDGMRKLTPIECERLQTVPDNYTEPVSNSQRYKMLGNGWTVDVIAHIFSFLK